MACPPPRSDWADFSGRSNCRDEKNWASIANFSAFSLQPTPRALDSVLSVGPLQSHSAARSACSAGGAKPSQRAAGSRVPTWPGSGARRLRKPAADRDRACPRFRSGTRHVSPSVRSVTRKYAKPAADRPARALRGRGRPDEARLRPEWRDLWTCSFPRFCRQRSIPSC